MRLLFSEWSMSRTVCLLFGQWNAFFFFFNDTATTEIYTLSLHDALPISIAATKTLAAQWWVCRISRPALTSDRKSTRLNSSHLVISYAVFCLKKKNMRPDLHTE